MALLESWKTSLLIFHPTNFKLFFFSVVKTLRNVYYCLFRYFWWLLILIVITFMPSLLIPLQTYADLHLFTFTFPIRLVLFIVFIQVLVLSARPSVERKNWAYFTSHLKPRHLLTITAIAFLLLLKPMILILGVSQFITLPFPIIVFFSLFYIDSTKGIKMLFVSFLRSLKMFLFTLPFIAAIYLILFILLVSLLKVTISLFGILVPYIAGLVKGNPNQYIAESFCTLRRIEEITLVFPVLTSLLTPLYVKMVHERYSDYFRKKATD